MNNTKMKRKEKEEDEEENGAFWLQRAMQKV
jgi:hypothetical protein